MSLIDNKAFSIAVFLYTLIEFNLYQIYRTSVRKCEARLITSQDTYKVPTEISIDVYKQFTVMPRIRTFLRDLFHADHHSDIKQGNLQDFIEHTMGITGSSKDTLIGTMISYIEEQLEYQFETGRNEDLLHTYCREDNVIRSVYMPAVISLPIISLKWACDTYVNYHYEKVSTEHVIYWIRTNTRGVRSSGVSSPRVLVFICGIGVGSITYFKICQALAPHYDVVIMAELKWISFHLMAEPVEDRCLIECLVEFLTGYLYKKGLGNFYKSSKNDDANNPDKIVSPNRKPASGTTTSGSDLFDVSLEGHHSGLSKEIAPAGDTTLDLMMHSGGALYCRRIMEHLRYTNMVLIEPACFLFGSSTATRQIYTYNTFFPLFQYPLVKNLPKLLDITECVIQTDTKLGDNTIAILSVNDSLFQPGPCIQFLEKFHPGVQIFLLSDSGHGGAVSCKVDMTCNIITKTLGYDCC